MATTWVSGIGFDDRWASPLREADDELDWSDIFSRYHLNVRAFVRSRVPAAWVDDTVQDTFVRAYRSRHRLDPTRPIWPWLVTIAKRACIETCRNHRTDVAFDGSMHAVAAPDDPHMEFERSQRAAAIAGALDALPPRHRRLLVRYEVEGRPYAELAGDENISGQALKSALCRARESFRARYAALAEVHGLAALPVLGPFLARWRGRWQRGHDAMSRMPPEVAGALFVGLTATAWIVGVPTAQRASSAPITSQVAMVGSAVGAAAPDATEVAVPGIASVGATTAPVSAEARVAVPPPPDGPEPTDRLLPRAGGHADIAHTPDGSTASVVIDIDAEPAGVDHRHETKVECGTRVSEVVCVGIRMTPSGR